MRSSSCSTRSWRYGRGEVPRRSLRRMPRAFGKTLLRNRRQLFGNMVLLALNRVIDTRSRSLQCALSTPHLTPAVRNRSDKFRKSKPVRVGTRRETCRNDASPAREFFVELCQRIKPNVEHLLPDASSSLAQLTHRQMGGIQQDPRRNEPPALFQPEFAEKASLTQSPASGKTARAVL